MRQVAEQLSWKELSKKHHFGLEVTFVICLAIGIMIDLLMVQFLKMQSISEMTWEACAKHDMIVVLGMILTYTVAWLVRHNLYTVFLAVLLGGHLFTHG